MTQRLLLALSTLLLALAACMPSPQSPAPAPVPEAPPQGFRLRVGNFCNFSVRVYVDGAARGTVTVNRFLLLEGIPSGEHTLLAEGLGVGQGQRVERRIVFDQDREWNLCAR
jgi:hypothetical protein